MTRPICDKCSVLHSMTGNELFLVTCNKQGQRWAPMVDGACSRFELSGPGVVVTNSALLEENRKLRSVIIRFHERANQFAKSLREPPWDDKALHCSMAEGVEWADSTMLMIESTMLGAVVSE